MNKAPYRVDWEYEEKRARNWSDSQLLFNYKDALEASRVSPNAEKYLDQISVYAKEMRKRNIQIPVK